MRCWAIAASKGGVGKTTLAIALATEAARRGERVAAIDLDPSRSLSRWLLARQKNQAPAIDLLSWGSHLEVTLERVKETYDLILIDTPPGSGSGTGRAQEAAVAASDAVVVPVRPSPLDVGGVDRVVELCRAASKPFVFVLTMTTNVELAAGARGLLKKSGRVMKSDIAMRDIYMSALLDGASGTERDAAAANEVSSVFDQIDRAVARTQKK